MWVNKFSRINKELIIDKIGQMPYSKEITNLILEKIDMETTFIHHLLPSAMDFLISLFGEIQGRDSAFSNLNILKRYYKEGELYYEEYWKFLGELGSVDIPDNLLDEIIVDKWGNDADYVKKKMEVYMKYSSTSLYSIIKLEERIKDLKRQEKEQEEEVRKTGILENKKRSISKVLANFKKH